MHYDTSGLSRLSLSLSLSLEEVGSDAGTFSLFLLDVFSLGKFTVSKP